MSDTAGRGAAPVALFVYNRLEHARQTVEALSRNELASVTDLIVFSDAPRSGAEQPAVQAVRDFVKTVGGFRSVELIERTANLGLAQSIISGVTTVCGEYGRVIVMEDDLVTSAGFLGFMNDALQTYEADERVGSIHGYWYPVVAELPPTFLLRGASCWGWATWSRAWRLFEPDGSKLLGELKRQNLTSAFDLDGAIGYTRMLQMQIRGRIDSWAIRWHASMFLANRLQLSPSVSLVRNIGFDGTGTHCADSEDYEVQPGATAPGASRIPLQESAAARNALIRYHRSTRRSLPTRVFGRLRRMVGI